MSENEEITLVIKSDTSAVQADTVKLDSGFAKLLKRSDSLSAELDKMALSIDKALNKTNPFIKAIGNLTKSTNTLNKAIGRIDKTLKSTMGQIDRYSSSLRRVNTSANVLINGLKRTESNFKTVSKSTNLYSNNVSKLNTNTKSLSSTTSRLSKVHTTLHSKINKSSQLLKKFNSAIKTLENRVRQLESSISKVNSKIDSLGNKSKRAGGLLSGLGDAAKRWGQRAMLALSAATVMAAKSVAVFQSEMANTSTLITGASLDMSKMTEEVLKLDGIMGSPTEKAKALYQALSASIEPAKAVSFVGDAARFGVAGVVDLTSSVDILTTILNGYKLEASKTGEVSDKLFQIIKRGKITGAELASTLGNVIPTANLLEQSLDEVGAVISTLTRVGIRAPRAVVGLNQMMVSIIRPSKEAISISKKLKIEMSKAGVIGAGGLQKWLIKLKDATKGSIETLAKLFPNIRAQKAVFTLLGAATKSYVTDLDLMGKSHGNIDEAIAKQNNTLLKQLEILKNDVLSKYTKEVLPMLDDLKTKIMGNIEGLSSTLSGVLVFVTKIGVAVGNTINFVANLAKYIESKSKIFSGLAFVADGWFKIAEAASELSDLPSIDEQLEKQSIIIASYNTQLERTKLRFDLIKESLPDSELKKLEAILKGLKVEYKNVAHESYAYLRALKDMGKGKYGDSIRDATRALVKDFPKALRDATIYIGNFDKVIIKSIRSLIGYSEQQEKAKKTTKELTDEQKELIKEYNKYKESLKIPIDRGFKEVIKEVNFFSKAVNTSGDVIARDTKLVEGLIRKAGDLSAEMERLGIKAPEAFDKSRRSLKSYLIAVVPSTKSTKYLQKAIAITSKEIAKLGLETDRTNEIQIEFLKISESQTKQNKAKKRELRDLKDTYSDLSSVMNEVNGVSNEFSNLLSKMGIGSDKLRSAMTGVTGAISSGAGSIQKIVSAGSGIMGTLSEISGVIGVFTAAINIFNTVASLMESKSTSLKQAEKLVGELGHVSNEWAEELEELSKQLHGGNVVVRAFNMSLADMISESVATTHAFEQFSRRTKQLLDDVKYGFQSSGEAARSYGKAFEELLNMAIELGEPVSKELIELIELSEQFGESVKEIADFVDAAIGEGFESFSSLQDILDLSDIQDEIDELNESLKDMKVGSDEYIEAQENLSNLMNEIEVITKLQEIFGDTTMDVYKDMFDMQEKIAANKTLVDAIKLWESGMMNYSKTNRATQDDIDDFQQKALDSYNQLIASGFSAEQALDLIQPQLKTIAELEREWGLSIGDNTQKLIDQARETGILDKDTRSYQEQQLDALNLMLEKLSEVVYFLGGPMPESLRSMGDVGNEVVKGISDNISIAREEFDEVAEIINTKVVGALGAMGDKSDLIFYGNSIIPDVRTWVVELGNVDDAINKDVIPSIRKMGGIHDDVMYKHSINVDVQKWIDLLKGVVSQINGGVIDSISNLSNSFDVLNGKYFDWQSSINILYNSTQSLFDALKAGNVRLALSIANNMKVARDSINDTFNELKETGLATKDFINMLSNQPLLDIFPDIAKFKNDMINSGFNAFFELRSLLNADSIQAEIDDIQAEIDRYEPLLLSIEASKLSITNDNIDLDNITAMYGGTISNIIDLTDKKMSGELNGSELVSVSNDIENLTKSLNDQLSNANPVIKSHILDLFNIIQSQKELDSLGFDVTKYDELKNSMSDLKDQFGDLNELREIFTDDTNSLYNDMADFQILKDNNSTFIKALDLYSKAFIDYSSVTKVSGAQFTAFSNSTVAAYDELIDRQFTSKQALSALAPSLERINRLQEQFGFIVDDSTQSLIDQALSTRLISNTIEDESLGAVSDIDRLIATLGDLVDSLNGVSLSASDMVGDIAESGVSSIFDDAIAKAKELRSTVSGVGGVGGFGIGYDGSNPNFSGNTNPDDSGSDNSRRSRSADTGDMSLNLNVFPHISDGTVAAQMKRIVQRNTNGFTSAVMVAVKNKRGVL